MHVVKGWMLAGALAGAVTLAPAVAAADVELDKAEKRLGRAVEMIVHGKHADAAKELRAALRQEPEMREAHYNLGVALRGLGAYDEAVREFEYAEEQYARADAANRAKCLYGAAMAKEGRGDRDAWEDYLKFARNLPVERSR
jgi:tetratricopeptide (TPR) repeat protein